MDICKEININLDKDFWKDAVTRTFRDTEYEYKIWHSLGVGDLAYDISLGISEVFPELGLNPDFCRFLGYVHDIGYIESPEDHEILSMGVLVDKYDIDEGLVRYVMHGHLAEKYALPDGSLNPDYLPKGLEGIILTYSDLLTDADGKHLANISCRIEAIKPVMAKLTQETGFNHSEVFNQACKRFLKYESLILSILAMV
jgi:HD superfamily phosphodiesterase